MHLGINVMTGLHEPPKLCSPQKLGQPHTVEVGCVCELGTDGNGAVSARSN